MKLKKKNKQPKLKLQHVPLWELQIKEVTGHNIESQGREEVNKLLKQGWILLHIYTLTYKDDGVWRERPMGILGKPDHSNETQEKT